MAIKTATWDEALKGSLDLEIGKSLSFFLDHDPAEGELSAFDARLHTNPEAKGKKFHELSFGCQIFVTRDQIDPLEMVS